MSTIIHSVTECVPVAGTDRTRITLAGDNGSHTFELTGSAIEALLPGLLAPPSAPGTATVATNAISPTAVTPFESTQGLCGLAFRLGDRFMHVAVPPSGIAHVRMALNTIEDVYQRQKR